MIDKIAEAGFRGTISRRLHDDLGIRGITDVAEFCRAVFATDILDRIGGGDFFVAMDIEGISDGLGDCQSKVQRRTSGDRAETVDDSPRFVERILAGGAAGGGFQRVLEADRADEGDERGGELAESLVRKNGGHHGAAPLDRREFAGDNRRQRVVSADACAKDHSPENHDADDAERRSVACERERQSRENDDDQFNSVHLLSAALRLSSAHPLAADVIGQKPEAQLSDNSSGRRGNLDRRVRRRIQRARLGVDVSDHRVCKVDREDVVRVGVTTVSHITHPRYNPTPATTIAL